jgi:hypothetical protein
MRALVALGLLITVCAPADAANSAFVLSTRFALATRVRHKPNVRTHDLRRRPLVRPVSSYQNYGNPGGATNLPDDGYTLWNGRSASEAGGF